MISLSYHKSCKSCNLCLIQFKIKTLNPSWLEMFDLRMYQGQTNSLEITVYDHDVGRDDFMGRYLAFHRLANLHYSLRSFRHERGRTATEDV